MSHCELFRWGRAQAQLSSEVYVQRNYCNKRSRSGTIFCRCGKKLGGMTELQEKNAQVTNVKGSQIIQALVQLPIVEQVRRGQRHGTSEEQGYWARDHFRRPTGKGVVTQSPKKRTNRKVAWIAGKKTKDTGIKCSSMDVQKKSCKAGMLKWKQYSVSMKNTVKHINYVNRYTQAS